MTAHLATLGALAILGLGYQELFVIFLLVLLLVGPKAIPALARALGQGMREFRSAANTFNDELTKEPPEEGKKPSVEPPATTAGK
ncbi:MAG: twin-arginine translocase TatA/TatE family subunit [Candidatus Sumerlaeia bacterium]|nr:twin-arginine translocase TatA/TatE family subunit [Candidatus Sumerlaeia bacterium]